MKLKVINGPNINMLGIREPGIYGKDNFAKLCQNVKDFAEQKNIEVELYQSNHEGDLVDVIQDCFGRIDGIVINPGAYTHTSIALLDAVKSVSIPTVEVHISKVEEREDFRQISYIRQACVKTITGHGIAGYTEAMDFLINYIKENNTTTCDCKGANHEN